MINGQACYSGPLWHVAYTAPRAEKDVHDAVRDDLDFTACLLHECVWTVRKGIKVKDERPLFPRYLFVRVDHDKQDWQEILDVDGVVDVLMASNDVPGYVSEAAMQRLLYAHEVGMFDRTTIKPNHFQINELVRVSDGPFSGLNATIIEFMHKLRSATASKRAKVLLKFMGQMTALDLPVTSLEKL